MVKVPVKSQRGVRVRIKRVRTSAFMKFEPRKNFMMCFRCKNVMCDEFVWYCPKCEAIVKREAVKLDAVQSD